ncbi:MAG: hypothetical protein EYC70_03370 [Planctomycetota bacterium]|nr:MAG: hypothetical protein EYC70_03370 [Planctomycetota bacterium]
MDHGLRRALAGARAALLLAVPGCSLIFGADEPPLPPPAPVDWEERIAEAEASGDLQRCVALAEELQQVARHDDAVALLQPFARAAETRVLAVPELAEVLRRAQRYLDAAAVQEELAAELEEPQRSWLYQAAAADRERGQDYGGALADLRRALEGSELAPKDEQALSRWLAFQTGQPENAADAVALLQSHPDPDKRLAGALFLEEERFEDELTVLAGALGDEDARVVRACARAFCARAAPAQAPQVASLLRHTDAEARVAAARALGRIGGTAEVPALLAALDPDDRALFRAARLSLERLTGHSIGAEIDPAPEERAAIAAAWRAWWSEHAPQP